MLCCCLWLYVSLLLSMSLWKSSLPFPYEIRLAMLVSLYIRGTGGNRLMWGWSLAGVRPYLSQKQTEILVAHFDPPRCGGLEADFLVVPCGEHQVSVLREHPRSAVGGGERALNNYHSSLYGQLIMTDNRPLDHLIEILQSFWWNSKLSWIQTKWSEKRSLM